MDNNSSQGSPAWTRRQFLRGNTMATVGLASILAAKISPVYAAKRIVSMLTWSHFIDTSNTTLRQMADEFGKANNCEVRIDFIPHHDTFIKAHQEQKAQAGHDIVFLHFSMPQLVHEALETLDFAEALGQKLGGWYDFARDAGQVQDRWVAIPWCCAAMPMTYREDLFTQHGFPVPQTWEGWKETGKQIKEGSGHQVGVALSQNDDSNITLYAILWSYGASTVDTAGRVTINSPETRRAMDYVKDLYETCMPKTVLSWDASSNNQAFLGGDCSWVHNATSIYGAAQKKAPEIFNTTNHALTPSGPGGQHGMAIPNSHGIWKFAKEKSLAKAFLQYIMDLNRLEAIFHATFTYNSPTYKAGENFAWQRDPKTAKLRAYMKTAHMIGWPSPPDRRAENARVQWIVPRMFTLYVTGEMSLNKAVSWGESQLRKIYRT